MASDQVTGEHAKEYVRLVNNGSKPGGDTMRQARTNVASSFAGTAAEDGAIEAAGGGPEDPVADVGAVANTIRRAGSAVGTSARGLASLGQGAYSQVSRPSSATRRAFGAVSTPSQAAGTLTRLVWAIALGLIVLEVASEATGQYWSFNLPATGAQVFKPTAYKPLYAGQTAAAPNTASTTVIPGAI